MKRARQLTKRERKAIHGKGPSAAPGLRARFAPSRPEPIWEPVQSAVDPSVPPGARGSVVEGAEARNWLYGVIEFAASMTVAANDDWRTPSLVCWLSPDESRRYDAAMYPHGDARDEAPLWDRVVRSLRAALPDEPDLDVVLRGHVLSVVPMESPMPRWQRVAEPLLTALCGECGELTLRDDAHRDGAGWICDDCSWEQPVAKEV